jgi:superfamily II DNA or RNA helicase
MRPPVIPTWLPQPVIHLRNYQIKAIEDIDRFFRNRLNKILVSGSPGSGKTALMAALARQAYNSQQKCTILVPMNCVVTKSAIDRSQMCGGLEQAGLGGNYGVFSGAFPELENPNAPIQIVTLQTLSSRPALHDWLSDSAVVLIDEGHTGSFFKEVELIYKSWRWQKIINFTATPFDRSQGVDERYGELERNSAVVKLPSYRSLQSMGHLVPLTYHALHKPLEKKQKLDLDSDSAIEWMLREWANRCYSNGIEPTHAIGFTKPKCKDFSQIDRIREVGAALGIRFEIVSDSTTQQEYEALMYEYEAGYTNLLCVQALSTGWDAPYTQSVLLFRQIKSRDRYMQAVGRVSRPYPGKRSGHVFDFAGNVQLAGEDSGLHPRIEDLSEAIDSSVLRPIGRSEGEAPKKPCVECGKKIPASCIMCPHCKAIQPSAVAQLIHPSTGNIVSLGSEVEARQSRRWAIEYFRQWRKIGYLYQWKPFAAMLKCKEIGIEVNLEDSEFWRGSIFEAPDSSTLRRKYEKELTGLSQVWGWDSGRVERELRREFLIE